MAYTGTSFYFWNESRDSTQTGTFPEGLAVMVAGDTLADNRYYTLRTTMIYNGTVTNTSPPEPTSWSDVTSLCGFLNVADWDGVAVAPGDIRRYYGRVFRALIASDINTPPNTNNIDIAWQEIYVQYPIQSFRIDNSDRGIANDANYFLSITQPLINATTTQNPYAPTVSLLEEFSQTTDGQAFFSLTAQMVFQGGALSSRFHTQQFQMLNVGAAWMQGQVLSATALIGSNTWNADPVQNMLSNTAYALSVLSQRLSTMDLLLDTVTQNYNFPVNTTWTDATQYYRGDLVMYNAPKEGLTGPYVALQQSLNITPTGNVSYWQLVDSNSAHISDVFSGNGSITNWIASSRWFYPPTGQIGADLLTGSTGVFMSQTFM